jgi:hypothetical protein
MRRTIVVLLILGVAAFCLAQKLRFTLVSRDDVLARADDAPATDPDRAARLRELFRDGGCNDGQLKEQAMEGAAAPNIICEIKGQTDRIIIVGAHYERTSSPARPIDNWTGASLLPSLYRSMSHNKRRHRIIFVEFADRGNELSGAEYFAGHLDASRLRHVEAMVNLDALGFSPTKVWTAHSDKDLVAALVRMMYIMKISASQIDIAAVGNSDSEPFASRSVPQITIHSMTQQNVAEHSASKFRPGNYYDSYRLLCGYLAYLDATLKPRSHKE